VVGKVLIQRTKQDIEQMIRAATNTDVTKTTSNSESKETKKALSIQSILGEFDKLLSANLAPDKANKVSEEELFAAVVRERIEALKGKDVAEQFSSALEKEKSALKKPDGFVPMEQATLNALKGLVADKKITAEEGSQVYSEAFSAAQLDDNKSALFDSRGGVGDPTVAMATLETALKQARSVIEKLSKGETTLDLKSLEKASANGKTDAVANVINNSALTSGDFTPNGTVFDGPEGFLFKPITNNEGKLAILLGREVTGGVSKVVIKDSTNKILEEALLQTAGIKETGREKWNFQKRGADYPKNITVEVTLAGGQIQRYQIPDPSKRYD